MNSKTRIVISFAPNGGTAISVGLDNYCEPRTLGYYTTVDDLMMGLAPVVNSIRDRITTSTSADDEAGE